MSIKSKQDLIESIISFGFSNFSISESIMSPQISIKLFSIHWYSFILKSRTKKMKTFIINNKPLGVDIPIIISSKKQDQSGGLFIS